MERMFESALLRRLIDLGDPTAAAILEWLVSGKRPATQSRVDLVWLGEPIRL